MRYRSFLLFRESLDVRDLVSVQLTLNSYTAAEFRDVPIYLRHSAVGSLERRGKIPYRLVTVRINYHIEAVAILGIDPNINEAVHLIETQLTKDDRSMLDACSSAGKGGVSFLEDEVDHGVFA
jgi:hypothetical protein